MNRINVLLLLLLVASAASLVAAQYQSRHLYAELERAQTENRQLDMEWNQLQLDQTANSKRSLIEAVARRDLHMLPISQGRIQYLPVPANAAAAGVSATPSRPVQAVEGAK